ncbi:MAG: cation:proton antiporter, partial [Candidatus Bathyarchaeia archaeon]
MGELEVYYKFILSIALILIVARGAGELAERFLNQPAVLGELLAGIAISPFALGGIIFQGDPILLNFGAIDHAFGIEDFRVMEVFSMIAVIVLLFHAGVETDVHQFMRLGFGGSAIAVGGVVVPFIAGYFVTTMFGYPPAAAIFMGAVLTATSIGITVRILMDMKRFHTKEGTTILVAAVVDDILAVIILALVVAIAVTGEISIAGLVTLGAIGFSVWFAIVMVGVKFHTYVSRILLAPFKKSGTMPIFALVFGLLLAYLMTLVQLHPVIGAYAAGLMFAATKERKEIAHAIQPVMLFLAPLFFVMLG